MVFYTSWPWIINDQDYNCSSRSAAEWAAKGRVDKFQGYYFAISGTFFMMLHILCLIAMCKRAILSNPCYRLMFFNGFIDLMDLTTGSLFTSYFNFKGTVFCTEPELEFLIGHLTYSFWVGASFNCIVIALNRVVEMIPAAQPLRFLFQGKLIYIWMFLSIFYMVGRAFFTRSAPFNSRLSAYSTIPFISDNISWEISHYRSEWFAYHNSFIIIVLIGLYSVLCVYVARMSRSVNCRIEKTQILLFLQAICICGVTAVAAILYLYLAYIDSPLILVLAANVLWQLSHGLHAIVYMTFNKQIRRNVYALFKKTHNKTMPRNLTTATFSTRMNVK